MKLSYQKKSAFESRCQLVLSLDKPSQADPFEEFIVYFLETINLMLSQSSFYCLVLFLNHVKIEVVLKSIQERLNFIPDV